MNWTIEFTRRAYRQLYSLNPWMRKLILSWIDKNLVQSCDPRTKGKGLLPDNRSAWQYKVSNYRMICDIREEVIIILSLSIGHGHDKYPDEDEGEHR